MTVGQMCALKAAELNLNEMALEKITGIDRSRVIRFFRHDEGLTWAAACLLISILGVDPAEAVKAEVSRWRFKAVRSVDDKAVTLRYHAAGINRNVAVIAGMNRFPPPPDGKKESGS